MWGTQHTNRRHAAGCLRFALHHQRGQWPPLCSQSCALFLCLPSVPWLQEMWHDKSLCFYKLQYIVAFCNTFVTLLQVSDQSNNYHLVLSCTLLCVFILVVVTSHCMIYFLRSGEGAAVFSQSCLSVFGSGNILSVNVISWGKLRVTCSSALRVIGNMTGVQWLLPSCGSASSSGLCH